jgi:hypothetical protein
VLRFLKVGYDAFEISASWATVLATGAAHGIHHHPNNYLSAVYYLRTNRGADTINFHDPRSQTGIIRPPVVALTAYNTDHVVVRVQNGTLLVFPAYLQHSVDANASAGERISVSFNIMFSAFTENLSKPLWGDAPASRRTTGARRAIKAQASQQVSAGKQEEVCDQAALARPPRRASGAHVVRLNDSPAA